MMRLLVSMFLFGFCVFSISGFDWPVKVRTLVSTFGDLRENRFHKGIDLGGGRQAVMPIADGEVVFVHEEKDPFNDLPTGLGSLIVLEHEGNLRSSYSQLENGTLVQNSLRVTADDVIAFSGDSGAVEGVQLHLQVTDRELKQIINPLLLLPVLDDRKAPVIRNISVIQGGAPVALENGVSILAGEVELVAQVYDPRPSVPYFWPMAPYRISVSLNGQQLFQITCDSLKLENGSFVMTPSDAVRFADLYYSPDYLRLGKLNLTPGRAGIEISSMDFEQNRSSVSVSFVVRNPEQ